MLSSTSGSYHEIKPVTLNHMSCSYIQRMDVNEDSDQNCIPVAPLDTSVAVESLFIVAPIVCGVLCLDLI